MADRPENEVDLEQQNVGPGGEAGGGEWPDPDAPSTGPASGEHDRSPGEAELVPEHGSVEAGPSGFKDVLENDPVVGGSASTPQDDDPRDRKHSPDPSAGGP